MELNHIRFKTAHLGDLRAFYADTFDCPVTNSLSDEFTVKIGTTDITFAAVDDGSDPFYHFAINIPQNQFNDAATWLADRVELLADPETGTRKFSSESSPYSQVYCLDPADNIVELIARHELSNDAERPFDSESFSQVSEIGLTVSDKERTVRSLTENIGVSLRDNADPSTITNNEDITPVGDDHGVFIVVQQGRQWFPTRNKAAEVYPITVGISKATSEYTFPDHPYRIYPS
jgi:hypothetical protein